MSHIQLGRYNQLEVVKEVDFGMYLNGDEDGEYCFPSVMCLRGVNRAMC